MDPMLQAFLSESRENLEAAGQSFLKLETHPDDASLMDDIFRAVHTIKGSSGLFDIAPLTQMVHAAEDVLDQVRAGQISLNSEHVDLFLDAMDRVSIWLDELDTTGQLATDAAHQGLELTQALRSLLVNEDGETSDGPDQSVQASSVRPEWMDQDWCSEHDFSSAITYTPETQCFFLGEDPLHLVSQTPGLLDFRIVPQQAFGDPLELDPYQANVVFQILSDAELDALQHHYRYVPDQLAWYHGESAEPEAEAPQAPSHPAHAILQKQISILSKDNVKHLEGTLRSVSMVASHAFKALDRDTDVLDAALAESLERQSAEPLLAALKGDDADTDTVAENSAPVFVREPIAQPPSSKAPERAESSAPKTLKVDQERIDQLMDLVGELVVAKNALPYLARKAETDYGSRQMRKDIEAQYGVIDRLSESLQNAMMAVRMVPMSSVFGRFPRLVRDLSRKLEKQINLTLEGEETEADKNVIEELSDPLIHLVRNSLDHGLESPDDRVDAGKPEMGEIWLRAIPQDDQVIIEVQDDGRGINPEVIKRKAYEKGLIDEDRLDTITDHEAIQLIFAPGFSTAEQVSDLSGRGVGMDVVRTVIERSGGSVVVFSELGKGSTVRLSLPLSMAINRVMCVEAAGQTYGIPMEQVRETVKVPRDSLQQVKHHQVLVLRDRLVPLRNLRELLGLEAAQETDEVCVLVMRIGDMDIGFVVDAFDEGLDIIQKPLEGVLTHYPYYSGAALLGDGSVLLVLNTKELLACH